MAIPDRIAGVKWQWWAIGGVASAGVVWWAYKRQSSKTAASTMSTDSTTTDPTIDPTTGLPYASEMYSPATGSTAGPSFGGIIDPTTGAVIGTVAQQTVTTISDKYTWAQVALQRLIAIGYDPVPTSVALGLFIAGGTLTQDQYSTVQAAIAQTGYPPGDVPQPHVATASGQTTGGSITGQSHWNYGTQYHQISVETPGRGLVQRFSVSNAPPNAIEIALRATVADPKNARYIPYFAGHGGSFPAKAGVTVHVVTGHT